LFCKCELIPYLALRNCSNTLEILTGLLEWSSPPFWLWSWGACGSWACDSSHKLANHACSLNSLTRSVARQELYRFSYDGQNLPMLFWSRTIIPQLALAKTQTTEHIYIYIYKYISRPLFWQLMVGKPCGYLTYSHGN
jgi:hypothetical protein